MKDIVVFQFLLSLLLGINTIDFYALTLYSAVLLNTAILLACLVDFPIDSVSKDFYFFLSSLHALVSFSCFHALARIPG